MISSEMEDRMVLQPLIITRYANAFGTLVLIWVPIVFMLGNSMSGAGIAGITLTSPVDWVLLVGIVLLFASAPVLAVRAWRFAVVCSPDRIVVRGYLRSRTVPIAQVIDVESDSTLVWSDDSGEQRRTAIRAFRLPNRALRPLRAHAAESLGRLSAWIDTHQRPAGEPGARLRARGRSR
ncbi:PH domain-containing protein [Streptosporangiaceae bacterium NEAU-GS5]|nr:PH domain-containing protein [Streptosporangiaceae bacterium NEAU-GS5]